MLRSSRCRFRLAALTAALLHAALLAGPARAQEPVRAPAVPSASPALRIAAGADLECPEQLFVGQTVQFAGSFTHEGDEPATNVAFAITTTAPLALGGFTTERGTWTEQGTQRARLAIGTVDNETVDFTLTLTAVGEGQAAITTQFFSDASTHPEEQCAISVVVPTGTVFGAKWEDLDGDGQRDADEPGLAGWRIFADDDGDGQHDADEPSTLTGAGGAYALEGLALGEHLVREVQQDGWVQTRPAGGAYAVAFPGPGAVEGADFGNRRRRPPDVAVTKTGFSSRAIGDTLSYTIRIANLGEEAATNVGVRDALPPSLRLAPFQTGDVLVVEGPRATGVQCAVTDGVMTCTIARLDPTASAQEHVVITIHTVPTQAGTLENVATVTADDDAEPGNNTSVPVVTVVPSDEPPAADLSVVKTVDRDSVALLQSYAYTLTVTNHGPADAFDVELTDTLPAFARLFGVPSTCTTAEAGAERVYTCALGPLAPGAERVLRFTAAIEAEAVGDAALAPGDPLVNRAEVAAGSPADPNVENDASAAAVVYVGDTRPPEADLRITISGPDRVEAGQRATYEVTVTNHGPDDAPGVRVTDVLPAGLTFVARGSSPECTAAGATVTCDLGTVAAGATRTVTLVAQTAADLAGGTEITNGVSIASDAEDPSSVPDNDGSTTLTIEVPCRAYVFIGDFNGEPGGGLTGHVAVIAADEAQSDYEKAGYTVVRNDRATRGSLQAAVQDPHARAIWFLGHGSYDDATLSALYNKFFSTPEPGLGFTNGYLSPRQLGPGPFPQVEQVTIHACGQDLPAWRAAFPTADANGEFDAWESPTRVYDIYWWQLGATYPRCSTADKAGRTATTEPPPAIHPSLWQDDQYHALDTTLVYSLAHVTNTRGSFVLTGPLRTAFEGVAFNVAVRDTARTSVLFSARIEDGVVDVANVSTVRAGDAAFDVELDVGVIHTLLAAPSRWPDLVAAGAVAFTNVSGGLTAGDLAAAIGTLLYGQPYAVADLGLAVSAPATAAVGDTVTFAVDVSNAGPDAAGAPELLVALPDGLALADAACVPHHTLPDVHVCPLPAVASGGASARAVRSVVVPGGSGPQTAAFVVRNVGIGEADESDNAAAHAFGVGTRAEPAADVPAVLVLHANYPDPFSAHTTIRYELPAAAHVRLIVYDLLGRAVAVLVDARQPAGLHAAPFDASALPSGVYLYHLEADGRRAARALRVVR